MRLVSNIFLAACFLAGADAAETAKGKSAAAPARKAAPAAQQNPGPVVVPKDAVELEPGLWAAKDEKGKLWHYRRTPFATYKLDPAETAAASAKSKESDEQYFTAAVEDGEQVRFERKTPFGPARWTRKKAEMNAAEKAAFRRLNAPAAPAKSAAQE